LNQKSKFLSLAIVLLVTAILYVVIILSISEISTAVGSNVFLYTIAFGFATIAILTLFYWLRDRAEYVDTINKELSVYKKLAEMKTHTFRVIESTKEIKILNEESDATLSYHFRCENTSGHDVERIRLRIQHDGNIESLHCEVNGLEVTPQELRELMTIDAKTHKPVDSLSRTSIFYISPHHGVIKPLDMFDYGYLYVGKKLYPKLKEKNREYTSTAISHPTSHLNTIVHAPEGYIFSDFKIEVLEREDSRHISEENRVLSECPPILLSQRRMILWTLKDPLLADIYRLFFSIERVS
jgi:hypothetical protein